MGVPAIALFLIYTLVHLGSHGEEIHPQNCTLNCIRKGEPECNYCRITQDDVKAVFGFSNPFGACVPWPCNSFLGETPDICQHYVHAPQNVDVHFVANPDPNHETALISWNPSVYGIGFLRGFQVSIQALGGTQVLCQLFLMQQNLSLTPDHTELVYYSDPFPKLTVDTQYAVTVMALPVPEEWDRFYQKKLFHTSTCPEKNGLEKCKKDWYPRYLAVEQDGHNMNVTFNLAPPSLQIKRYFSSCYGGGQRTYIKLEPDLRKNNTHYVYRLPQLSIGINYSCEIAADVVDAVRKKFSVEIQPTPESTSPSSPDISPFVALVPLGIILVAALAAILTALWKRKHAHLLKKYTTPDDFPEVEVKPEEQFVSVTSKSTPPSVLIVYSTYDGPAHVRVVLSFAAFLQRHMAIKVFLDMWDSLSVMEEGALGWYCRKLSESDFILVICSPGLRQPPQGHDGGEDEDDDEDSPQENISSAMVDLIAEELCRAKTTINDISRYITAVFEYSKQTDVPTVLGLATHYTLTTDLPLLFSHLHGVALQQPGTCLKVESISEDYTKLPAGEALRKAIEEAKVGLSSKQQQPQPECKHVDRGPALATTAIAID